MKSASRKASTSKSTPINDLLAAVPLIDRIATCEPRLALSASAAADILVDTLSLSSSSFDVGSEPEPIADAATIRARYSLDGAGQTVAVIDSGIAWNHVAFANQKSGTTGGGFGDGYRVVAGWDFAENDANPYDDGPAGYHGTHVAGTLAGYTAGFAGIAPGVDLVALRVFDDFGNGSLDWIESALRWVVDNRNSLDNPITTVNLSLGAFAANGNQPLVQLDDELRSLRDHGVIVVAAAGNSFDSAHPDSLAYPASHPLVAAVTAVDSSGRIEPYAQRAGGVFGAPGRSVDSSVPDHVLGVDGNVNDFTNIDGTSTAAPQLAGAAILVREAMQSLGQQQPTPDDILTLLRETSIQKTDAISGASYHVLDLESAIERVLGSNDNADSAEHEERSPLQWTGQSSLVVHGSSDPERIVLNLNSPMTITINSVVHQIDRRLDSVTIHGGLGSDTLEIVGSTNDERLTARASVSDTDEASAMLTAPGFTSDFRSFETVIFHGGGGNNRASFYDSVGNDTLEASPDTASFRGSGFLFVAMDVSSVHAYGTAGGSDTAYLYDSEDHDRLAIRHQFTSLRSDSMFRLAYGFERVHAYSNAGGDDEANLYDSPGDDLLSASAAVSWISGRDYYAGARGFATVRAESTLGGNDQANLYAADSLGSWTRASSLVQLNLADGEIRSAQGFRSTDTFIGGEKATVLPQSLRFAYHEEERKALRSVFDSSDDTPLPSSGDSEVQSL